jgi:hypothetical protein
MITAPAELTTQSPEQDAHIEKVTKAFKNAMKAYEATITSAQQKEARFQTPSAMIRMLDFEDRDITFIADEGVFSEDFIKYLYDESKMLKVVDMICIPDDDYWEDAGYSTLLSFPMLPADI